MIPRKGEQSTSTLRNIPDPLFIMAIAPLGRPFARPSRLVSNRR
jgi:hypothetical protein